MKKRTTIYYEFYNDPFPAEGAQPLCTGTKVLGETTIITGVDTIPTLSLTVPLEELPAPVMNDIAMGISTEPRLQNYTIKVYFQVGGETKYIFPGLIDYLTIDDANYNAALSISHIVARMRKWPMPVNCTIKDMEIQHALGQFGVALGYSPSSDGNMQGGGEHVNIAYIGDAGSTKLELTFGSNNKLEALSEAIENTEKLHFYVNLEKGNEIVIGELGEDGHVIFSPYPYMEDECEVKPNTQNSYITMLTEPRYKVDYTSHFNRVIVFCGDVAYGVAHLTLQYMYDNPAEQNSDFPVGKYEYARNLLPPDPNGYGFDEDNKRINNEKIYSNFETIAMQSNGNIEYYVTDTKQLEEDSGTVLDQTYNFNDLYPIPSLKRDVDGDGEEEDVQMTEDDRKEMVRRAYRRAIRKLKANRPGRLYEFNSEALPRGVADGQKLILQYSKKVKKQSDECENKLTTQTVVNIDAPFYLTKRTIVFDQAMNEYTKVSLDSELRARDVGEGEIDLYPASSDSTTEYVPTYSGYSNDTYEGHDRLW